MSEVVLDLCSVFLIYGCLFVDKYYMEIICCLESKPTGMNFSMPKMNLSMPKLRRISASRMSFGKKHFSVPKTRIFSVHKTYDLKGMILTARGRFFYALKNIRMMKSYAICLPVLAAMILVPYGISRALNYHDSFFSSVNLTHDSSSDYEFIDVAMNEFALDRSAYYDSEGNVFGADGDMVESTVKIKDPVSFQNYTVKAGDTVGGISHKFGLSNISTIIAVNNIPNVRAIYTGMKLVIPSTDGLIHKVSSGETLDSIAKKYSVYLSDLLDVNDLSSSVLVKGQEIFVPGAKLSSSVLQKAMGEVFSNPLKTKYKISSYFGPRNDPFTGARSNHTGVDMACPRGTPIYSAKSGTVAYTGWHNIYGNFVIVKHIEGYETLYAHMSKINCKKGDKVSQSSVIGFVGSTGYSTGNHLHFTVYKNHKLVNPLTLIK